MDANPPMVKSHNSTLGGCDSVHRWEAMPALLWGNTGCWMLWGNTGKGGKVTERDNYPIAASRVLTVVEGCQMASSPLGVVIR